LIEVGSHNRNAVSVEDDERNHGHDEPTFSLRILGNFSTRYSIHTEQEQIPQQWFSPVALFVCHESRQHTLRHYTLTKHQESEFEPFYCDPSVDILWFNYEFTGHAVNLAHVELHDRMDKLCKKYRTPLKYFKTVLVDEIFWNPDSGDQEYLALLLGLETILIMDTSREDASREDAIPTIYDREDWEHLIAAEQKEYAKLKEKHPDWALKSIQYLARDANTTGFLSNTAPKTR
jgi:2EXR family